MYERILCSHSNCTRQSISCPKGETLCTKHHPAADILTESMIQQISVNSLSREISFAGLRVSNVNLQKKHFLNCDFNNSYFENCSFDGSLFHLTMFDHSTFVACSFKAVCSIGSILACSDLQDCIFEESDLIQNNFNGTNIERCSFNDSDLFCSRFVSSHMKAVKMRNCNLKSVMFTGVDFNEIDLKYSNTRDTIMKGEDQKF